MKKCNFCAEEVQDDAKKCKHCGEWFIEDKTINQVERKEKPIQDTKKLEGFSGWLAFFGFCMFVSPIYIFYY